MATCKDYNHADVMSYLFQHELVEEALDLVVELCKHEGSTKVSNSTLKVDHKYRFSLLGLYVILYIYFVFDVKGPISG